ncbi:hypothetical protein SNOG_05111 [Parastagonospora nodorum SN15]|uniref:Uncharacterized protein n=1 Tax=Phaeosphaeria nodorum (strain SN15 / ATCC MYA-4574 / FGSC 10173) TaxID=321614 RepID=Q0UT03_PHANO|nr:hypothetical protein SNOG_05111 [Parastagonospora nodorum SN15]EAT87502.1 hypothetical protein SNOG_05111 [Parastagonospora nodorum SN15]
MVFGYSGQLHVSTPLDEKGERAMQMYQFGY